MLLLKMLPGFLKELTYHVPTILFEVVDWGELAQEIPRLGQRILQKDGQHQLLKEHQKIFSSFAPLKHLSMIEGPHPKKRPILDQAAGENLLLIYFAQLHFSHGLFLDMRSMHFLSSSSNFLWAPGGMWTVFDESFRIGLLKVYDGFYLNQDDLYQEGLIEMGLLRQDFSNEDKYQLANLFKAHFSAADSTSVEFKLEHLKNSMIKMSEFMLNKKINISKDFLYLGIYLVTLYSSLEETQGSFAVKDLYLKARLIHGVQ
jgi:hypothetical protein